MPFPAPIEASPLAETPALRDPTHPYAGQRAVLATMHGKATAIAPALAEAVGLRVEAIAVDTDALGTFSGEVERPGPMLETAIAKARLAMAATGATLGLASEGSFGPHPWMPFLPGGIELLVLVDDARGIAVHETLVPARTNFAHEVAAPGDALDAFLTRVGFPHHGLIVRAHAGEATAGLVKGITDHAALAAAVAAAAALSPDGRARIETDMRAHLNPTRMAAIADLARQLGARLAARCPGCGTPGWGRVDVMRGLPCGLCATPTELIAAEIFGCPACDRRERRPRRDGRTAAEPGDCPACNP